MRPNPQALLARHPAWSTAAGALCVSASAIFISLAHTTPGTVALYRCLFALPFLLLLARLAPRPAAPPGGGKRAGAWAAGVLLAADMLLWARAVSELGAGPSTVVVNMQVVLVPLIAWLVDREPVTARFLLVLPPLLLGVVLTGGVLFGGGVGSSPGPGLWHASAAALSYAGFLYLLRRSSGHGGSIRTMLHVTFASTLASLVGGLLWQGIRFAPGVTTLGWLLALSISGQVVGWLLVAAATPRLPNRTAAVLLLLTPVGALVLAAAVLSERPDPAQLLGCLLVLVSVPFAVTSGGDRTERQAPGCAATGDGPAQSRPVRAA